MVRDVLDDRTLKTHTPGPSWRVPRSPVVGSIALPHRLATCCSKWSVASPCSESRHRHAFGSAGCLGMRAAKPTRTPPTIPNATSGSPGARNNNTSGCSHDGSLRDPTFVAPMLRWSRSRTTSFNCAVCSEEKDTLSPCRMCTLCVFSKTTKDVGM